MKKIKHYLLLFLLIFSNYLVFAAGGGGAKPKKGDKNKFTSLVQDKTDIPDEVKAEITSLRERLKAIIAQVVEEHYASENPKQQQLELKNMMVLSDIFSNEDTEKKVMNWVKETFEELEKDLDLKKILATAAHDSLPDLKTSDVLSPEVFQKYKEFVNVEHNARYEEFFTEVKKKLEKKITSEFSDSADILKAILQDDTLHAFYASYLDKISKNLLKGSDLIPNKPGAELPEERKSIYDDLREGKASVQEICDENGYTIETFGLKNFSPVSKQENIIVKDKKGNPVLDKKTGLPITKVPKQQAPIQRHKMF